jgi:hypothetical protein
MLSKNERNGRRIMTTSDYWFLESLLDEIIKDCKIPKVQVERTIGTVLSIFIEDILNEYYKKDIVEGDKIRLVTKEYPIKKKGNDQSENCDFLLANKKFVYLTELKTSVGSFDPNQFELYNIVKNRIQSSESAFLIDDVYELREKNEQYQFIINEIKTNTYLEFDFIDKCKILYIGPSKLKEKLDLNVCDFISLTDLSLIGIGNNLISSPKRECWIKVGDYLRQIDEIRCK